MNILIGCSSPPDRGSGILSYTKNLCESLIEMGAEIHLASQPPDDWSWLECNSISHFATKYEDDPFTAARNLLAYIRDKNITGVINNDNPLIQSISPGLPCPVIIIGHLDRFSIATLACYRHEWSDYVVAISNEMRATFMRKYGVPPYKCPVIHNGVRDLGHNGDYGRKSPHVLKVVYAGEYSRRKGSDLILKALARGSEAWRDVEFQWFADVPRRIRNRYAREGYVEIHGRVSREQLLISLRNADIFLLSSRAEGCPMAMLEAMSMGVVPIASDGKGAMRWLIDSGIEGYICSLNQWSDQTIKCIQHLRDNPTTLRNMKIAVRARYVNQFQMANVARKLVQLMNAPTVDRKRPKARFEVLYWHRPLYSDRRKPTILDRFRMRAGLVQTAGLLT